MTISKLKIWKVEKDKIAWSFEPKSDRRGGVLDVTIPVHLRYEPGFFEFFPSMSPDDQIRYAEKQHDLKITLYVDDTLTAEERAVQVFPPDMPLADTWPFSCRVDVVERLIEREQDAKKRQKLIEAGADPPPKPKYIRRVVTVDIRVFALQGVRVSTFYQFGASPRQILEPLTQASEPLVLSVRIDKVNRPEALPDPEQPVENRVLYPAHPVDLGHSADGRMTDPRLPVIGRFLVRHRPNRVDITWMATQATLSLELAKPNQPGAGFTYWFNPQPDLGGETSDPHVWLDYDDLLHIHVAGEVTIRLTPPVNPPKDTNRGAYERDGARIYRIQDEAELFGLYAPPDGDPLEVDEDAAYQRTLDNLYDDYFVDPFLWNREPEHSDRTPVTRGEQLNSIPGWPAEEAPRLLRPMEECRFFRLITYERVADLPAFGARARIEPEDDDAIDQAQKYMDVPDNWRVPLLAQIGTDLALGFLAPGVSDMVDYAEFNYALATGKDRWGNDVADWELVLMALSVVPIAGTGATVLRRLGRLF